MRTRSSMARLAQAGGDVANKRARLAQTLLPGIACLAMALAGPVTAQDVSYTYDTNGRLVHVDYANGTTIAYTFDVAGNILHETVSAQSDADGVPDSEEQGPNGTDPSFDGNGDGTPDRLQANVASLRTFDHTAYVTISVPPGSSLVGVEAVSNPSPADTPAGAQLPFGFFAFTVTPLPAGGCTAVTLVLPKTAAVTSYLKHGSTPANTSLHWYDYSYDGQTGAVITQEASRTTAVLHLCDGLRGDAGITVDGRIDDPGAPANRPAAGDLNFDGTVNVIDVFYLINHLFAGGPAPLRSGDVNGDTYVNVQDVFYLINYLFAGGPAPS